MSSTTYHDERNQAIAENLGAITNLVSRNEEMINCLELAHFACKSSAPVLITGESGTGKSLLAMAIHYTSPKKTRPCVTLNCTALRSKEIKNRLFGGEGGGGLLDKAAGGTIIIDAVDHLPDFVQRELLTQLMGGMRQIEQSAVRRSTAARLVSTSGSELSQKAADGLFVEDLIYCLGEVTIRIPPLRERREDIPELTRLAVQTANQAHHKAVGGLSRTASDFLRHYDFPGNVRELFQIIARAVRGTARDTIYVEDLGMVVDSIESDPHLSSDMTLLPLAEMEKRHISKALLRTGWKRKAAAHLLRISQSMLERKIRIYGLEKGSHANRKR